MIAIPAQEERRRVFLPSRCARQADSREADRCQRAVQLTSTRKIAGRVMIALTRVMPIPNTPAEPGSRGRRTGVE